MYDEMSVTFVLYFKKAASSEANYKLENKFCVRCEIK